MVSVSQEPGRRETVGVDVETPGEASAGGASVAVAGSAGVTAAAPTGQAGDDDPLVQVGGTGGSLGSATCTESTDTDPKVVHLLPAVLPGSAPATDGVVAASKVRWL